MQGTRLKTMLSTFSKFSKFFKLSKLSTLSKNKIAIFKPTSLHIIDRYIAKQIIGFILLASVALLGIDLFFNLINEVKVIGKGNYSMRVALGYIALIAPSRFYAMFPWSALIGSLMALGSLASHRELVVMRAASVSVYRIAWSVIKAALILTFFIVLIGEAIAPISERAAQNKRSLALSAGQSIQTSYGLWIRNDQEFIHIMTIRSNHELCGVTRYQFDAERKLKSVSHAEVAYKEKGGWRLLRIRGTKISSQRTESFYIDSLLVPKLFEAEILETAAVKHPERLSLKALWRTIHQRAKNELNSRNYELAFWSKIFQPVLILVMVFIAVPFVFGPLRSATMGFKILSGILVAYLFHILNGMFAPLALVYQVPPIVAVLIPLLVFSGLGFGLLKRVK